MQYQNSYDAMSGPETQTTLLDVVSAVSDLTRSDEETVQVVRHMLRSGNFHSSAIVDFDLVDFYLD